MFLNLSTKTFLAVIVFVAAISPAFADTETVSSDNPSVTVISPDSGRWDITVHAKDEGVFYVTLRDDEGIANLLVYVLGAGESAKIDQSFDAWAKSIDEGSLNRYSGNFGYSVTGNSHYQTNISTAMASVEKLTLSINGNTRIVRYVHAQFGDVWVWIAAENEGVNNDDEQGNILHEFLAGHVVIGGN